MNILITGASGFIGRELTIRLLKDHNCQLRVLTRNVSRFKKNDNFALDAFEWEPSKNYIQKGALDNIDVIINLAGENIASSRWSDKKKQSILNSRIDSIKCLLSHIEPDHKVKKFISASAIGIYGDRADEKLDEVSSSGEGFLADVCKKWEEQLYNNNFNDINFTAIRTGLVLGNGGALAKMLTPFKFALGGKLGDGQQYMSWIHIDDLVSTYTHCLFSDSPKKIYNAVSPNPVTNEDFTAALASTLKKPAFMKVPRLALETILGEMSQIVLASQRVVPQKLIDNGFIFRFETIEQALNNLLQYDVNGENLLTQYQVVSKKKESIFDFFSSEKNLEKLTPPFLKFKVLRKSTNELGAGTIIDYKLKIKGIPVKWKTLIEKFEINDYFIDNQIKGPYKKWHHTHEFHSIEQGTLMIDRVVYKVPFGILGRICLTALIKKDINSIFKFRRRKINELFNH